MAKMTLILAFFVLFQGVFGDFVCEQLPVGMCSFSVASTGNRCLLETYDDSDDGTKKFQCKTSQVAAMNFHEYIESNECVTACGLDRNSVGISSDSLLESSFIVKLCSNQCYNNCPNIVELYNSLALAEGVFLPELCKSRQTSERRSVIQVQSLSAASGPISAADGPMSASAMAPAGSSPLDSAPAPM